VPESIIPSADAPDLAVLSASFQMSSNHAVRLPESFRGGCSFGAGIKADLSRRDCTRTGGEETRSGQGCQRREKAINGLCVLRQLPDLPAQFLDTGTGLV